MAKGSDETAAHRDGGGLGAGVDPELGEEIGNVGLHGAGADEKRLANLFVGQPFDQQTQHIEFAGSETCMGMGGISGWRRGLAARVWVKMSRATTTACSAESSRPAVHS